MILPNKFFFCFYSKIYNKIYWKWTKKDSQIRLSQKKLYKFQYSHQIFFFFNEFLFHFFFFSKRSEIWSVFVKNALHSLFRRQTLKIEMGTDWFTGPRPRPGPAECRTPRPRLPVGPGRSRSQEAGPGTGPASTLTRRVGPSGSAGWPISKKNLKKN